MEDEAPWYQVAFRLWGEDLAISEIGPTLGVDPTYAALKGQHYGHNPKYDCHPTNIWTWSVSTDSSIPFEHQLESALDVLESHASYVQQLLSTAGAGGDFFLGYSSDSGQGGADFSPRLLARIARLGLSLCLDLYPPGATFDPVGSGRNIVS